MLKQGVNKKTIIEKLKELYIVPALNKKIKSHLPAKEKKHSPAEMRSFVQRPFLGRSKNRTRIRRRNSILLHDGIMKEFHWKEGSRDDYKGLRNIILPKPKNHFMPVTSPPRQLYLGLNKIHRKFKVWLLPKEKNDDGLYSALYRHMIGSA